MEHWGEIYQLDADFQTHRFKTDLLDRLQIAPLMLTNIKQI